MTQPNRPRPLRLVSATPCPVDDLLAALERWADVDGGEPAAYLELGDGELTGEFVLTAAHASQLAALLQDATAQHPGPPKSPTADQSARVTG